LYPLNDLESRLKKQLIIKNKNSAWYKSISISRLKIDNEKITFPDFFKNDKQEKLF
jgi:hypothetical protein